jgi:hypothetical protein
MNFPISTEKVKKFNYSTCLKIGMYFQDNPTAFVRNDDETHARAQAIADAVNAGDPSKSSQDSVLVGYILEVLADMKARVAGYPNVLVACGYDPSILFMVADTEEEAKSSCVFMRLCLTNWEA